ncbi:MAG: hypothetical protein KJ574_00905, partial [Nanoarchaeota archaeon]|nr:hypothetical protein [Nanoarchaeota archaeon]
MERGCERLLCILLLLTIGLAASAFAADEVSISVNRLNYWNAESHIFTVANSGGAPVEVNYTIPSGWSWSAGTGCSNPGGSVIQCAVAASGSSTFTLTSSASDSEYQVNLFSPTGFNNSYTEENNVSTLRVSPGEIFHTLVEYGRGRGNYLYDSGSQRAGSGKSAPGCTYLPNGTMFELNFLHKVQNIQQYLGLPDAEGEDATFSCTYSPNVSVVRKHLVTSITRGANWAVDYDLPEVSSSWERMGYIGMDYDATELAAGNQVIVNCTNLVYNLSAAYGQVRVAYTDVVFTVTNRNPFTITAATPTTIGNGTQEVEITYTITNTAPLALDNVIIEIEAPQYATFIGTRGELWGSALDQYRIEKIELGAGATETIVLIARVNTTGAGALTQLPLSQGVKMSFVPCWEVNAYNPAEFLQYLAVTNNATVSMAMQSTIVNIIERI